MTKEFCLELGNAPQLRSKFEDDSASGNLRKCIGASTIGVHISSGYSRPENIPARIDGQMIIGKKCSGGSAWKAVNDAVSPSTVPLGAKLKNDTTPFEKIGYLRIAKVAGSAAEGRASIKIS